MTPREQRRFRKQFTAQVEQERNGAPIPGDVAERMTKPKPATVLYQVNVTLKSDRSVHPFGPMMIHDAAGLFCEAINQQILLGNERAFTNATVVPLSIIGSGE